MKGRTIVLYGDIIFETAVLEKLLKSPAEITLVVDLAWSDHPETGQQRHLRPDLVKLDPPPGKNYLARFIMPEGETAVRQIGQDLAPNQAHGEFIGMAMFSEHGMRAFTECYRASQAKYKAKGFHEAGDFMKASLPDLIQELIDTGVTVQAVPIYKGWMEVDSFEEYQQAWAKLRG
jgi:phosphoenolpyruvate phosphomutase